LKFDCLFCHIDVGQSCHCDYANGYFQYDSSGYGCSQEPGYDNTCVAEPYFCFGANIHAAMTTNDNSGDADKCTSSCQNAGDAVKVCCAKKTKCLFGSRAVDQKDWVRAELGGA
jgi:hypothetical protein